MRFVPGEDAPTPSERRAPRRRRALSPAALAGAAMLLSAAAFSGCEGPGGCCFGIDDRPPGVPLGFSSRTGDGQVELLWYGSGDRDLRGYHLFRNDEPRGYFRRIATLGPHAYSYVDRDVHNGQTYWYALSAFDDAGNESDLTSEDVFDTPRPEGFSVRLANAAAAPETAGYDFSRREVVDARALDADVYYWQSPDEGAWMVATERSDDQVTDIQDAGYMPLDDVGWAPVSGWSPTGESELIAGHSYIVWTWDDHYAKFRVVSLSPERAVIDWAYQTDRGNPELSTAGVDAASRRPGAHRSRTHQTGLSRRNP
jgi:hypothetical protein